MEQNDKSWKRMQLRVLAEIRRPLRQQQLETAALFTATLIALVTVMLTS